MLYDVNWIIIIDSHYYFALLDFKLNTYVLQNIREIFERNDTLYLRFMSEGLNAKLCWKKFS